MIRLDDKEAELREQNTSINEAIDTSRAELSKLTSPHSKSKGHDHYSTSYKVSLVIDLSDDISRDVLELQFSYVVHNATWTPSYDLRINSVSNELNLTYFAEVTQCTGEDWNDCRLSLSTSNPAIGSAPPPLPNALVTIRHDYDYGYNGGKRKNKRRKSNVKKLGRGAYRSDSSSDEEAENILERHGSFSLLDEEMNSPTGIESSANTSSRINVKGTGDAGSTMFLIPRDVCIQSDSKPHKVTVMMASFAPQMVHYVAPAVSSHAYIQAKTQNTSQYPLLASKSVSVFLDGNFVASSSSIDQTSSGEYFSVYLGVDPSLKVVYTPCRTTQQTKGWLNGTSVKKCFYSTIIHNTKQRPCKVIVAEVLPRSTNDKISVELIEPPVSSLSKSSEESAVASERDVLASLDSFGNDTNTQWPKDFVTQNKVTNNIVWLKTIAGGDKVALAFSYKISWPQGQDISVDAT